MNKIEVCEALERAILARDADLSASYREDRAFIERDLLLLRTLKERIERGVMAGLIKKPTLIIDWSEGEGG